MSAYTGENWRPGVQPYLIPYVQYALDWFAYAVGGSPAITSTFRTFQEQQQLYDNRAKNPYPVNRPGDSAHQWGLAWDSWVPDDEMASWIAIRQAIGWRVPDNDPVHAEVPSWREIVRAAGYQV